MTQNNETLYFPPALLSNKDTNYYIICQEASL